MYVTYYPKSTQWGPAWYLQNAAQGSYFRSAVDDPEFNDCQMPSDRWEVYAGDALPGKLPLPTFSMVNSEVSQMSTPSVKLYELDGPSAAAKHTGSHSTILSKSKGDGVI